MSRFYGSVSKSQNGQNQFVWVIDTSISDRTVTAYFKIFAKGAYTPYYSWNHTVKCVVGGNTVLNTTGRYPNSDGSWVACSENIGGTTYKRVYTLTSGSTSVGNSGGSVTSSFSYSITGSADYLPTKGTKTVSGTDSIGAKTGSFNLNILLPDGSEPYSTGAAGSVEFSSNGGSSYTRLYNEPSGSYTIGTSFVCRNFSPGTGLHLSGTSGFNSNGGSGPWYATQGSSTTLTFNTAWNTYTIAYNANGGSGAPGSQTKTYGTNLTLSSTTPSRTGYTFLGWSTSNTATSASYSAGATLSSDLTASHGVTVTLYAVWSINSYYLDLNGWLDGAHSGGLSPYGTANVTVNGTVVGANVTDYYAKHNYGSSYSISNIKAKTGYQYNGVHSGKLSGTIGAGTVSVSLDFSTTKPSSLKINGSVQGPFEIDLSWSATGLNITKYVVYANGTQIYSGTDTSFVFNCAEETTYNIYFTATNVGGTTTSNTITLTTPADQAKIRIKKDGTWQKGKAYYKKDGAWVKAKKIYIKVDGKWKINNNYDS